MQLFDVSQYELLKKEKINFKKTKKQMDIFLYTFQKKRELAASVDGRTPTLQSEINEFEKSLVFTLNLPELNEHSIAFRQLTHLFLKGYYSISHPNQPIITSRRRQIYIMRNVLGWTIQEVSDSIHYQKNVIISDNQKAIILFSDAIGLIVENQP